MSDVAPSTPGRTGRRVLVPFAVLAILPFPAGAQDPPPLPPRLTSVDARLYSPVTPPAEDPFGYPVNDIDKRAIIALLETDAFDELEAQLRALHDATRADIRGEFRLNSAYFAFDRADAVLTALLDGWVDGRPTSLEARLARAKHRIALAWKSRGGNWLAETSSDRIQGMTEYAALAAEDVGFVMERAPDHLMALDLAFGVLMFGGWSDAHPALLERGLAAFPLSALLRENAMDAARPIWGGSWALMESIAEEAAARAAENPRLATFRGYALAERGRLAWMDDDLPAAVHWYTQALEHGPDPMFLIGRGEVWLGARDYTRALTDLVDASYQIPQSPNALELRTHALFEIAQFAPPDLRDEVLDRAWESVNLAKEVDPERANIDELSAYIGEVRAACRARSPRCRGRTGSSR